MLETRRYPILRLKKTIAFMVSLTFIFSLSSQEKLLSAIESYYDFLSLDGYAERPYLNYRTLSDSKWSATEPEKNYWAEQIKFGSLNKSKTLRIFGPELFVSYNGASPYGQNDGLLWQGKGINAYLSAGIRYEKKGWEITFKPELSFSANR
ncbi:MAG: hypothetical protein PHD30_04855, partial [Paludibacter sp.]|nr:hypothetical protein [Paludibacter sp.]